MNIKKLKIIALMALFVMSALVITPLGLTQSANAQPPNIIYQAPITIYNNQSVATPNPFQQLLQLNESIYNGYITFNGTVANFEFSYANNTIIPAWIEANNSGILNIFISIVSIPANSQLTIYIDFASLSTNLLSSSGTTGIGEAPQLSPTHGEYDDGASVFEYYQNFGGLSALPSGWSTLDSSFITYYSTYITIDENGGSTLNYIYLNPLPSSLSSTSTVWEFYGSLLAGLNVGTSTQAPSTSNYNSYYFSENESSNIRIIYFSNGGTEYLDSTGYSDTGNQQVYTMQMNSATSIQMFINYKQIFSTTSATPESISYLNFQTSSNNEIYVWWVDSRALPPNGVMPSVSYNSVSVPYTVTFNELNLPSNTMWNITINNNLYSTNTTLINVTLGNGIYAYEAQSSNPLYSPIYGNVTVNGANQNVSLNFIIPLYNITFNESGLPSGTEWNITLTNSTYNLNYYNSTNTTSLNLNIPNTIYSYIALANNFYNPIYGNITVNYTNLTINITFTLAPTYNVEFIESNLPTNTLWNITINNVYSTNTTSINVSLPNGTFSYEAQTINPLYSPDYGNITVSGANITYSITFSLAPTYTVEFIESGLPSNTLWNITLYNSTYNLNYYLTTNITVLYFSIPNSTYSYTALANNFYNPVYGNITVNGANITYTVIFTLAPTYNVEFIESGLPSGTEWNTIVNTIEGNSTNSTDTTSMNFTLPNGNYTYLMSQYNLNVFLFDYIYNGIVVIQNGNFTVNNSNMTIYLNFTLYSVNFNIINPYPYNIEFSNSSFATGLIDLNNSFIEYMPNGTYYDSIMVYNYSNPFAIISGYVSPFTVSGANLTFNIMFSTYNVEFNITGLPSGDTFLLDVFNTNNGSLMFSTISSENVYALLPNNATYNYTISVADNNITDFNYTAFDNPSTFTIDNNLIIVNVSIVYDVLLIQESGLNANTEYYINITYTSNSSLILSYMFNSSISTEWYYYGLPIDVNLTVTAWTEGLNIPTTNTFYFTGNYSYDFDFQYILNEGNITLNIYEVGLPLNTIWYFNITNLANNEMYNISSYYSFITFFNMSSDMYSFIAYAQGYNIISNPQYNLLNNSTITINFILSSITTNNSTTFTNPYNATNIFNFSLSQWETVIYLGGSGLIMGIVGAFINPIGAFIVLGIELLIGYELSIIDAWVLFFIGLAITALIFYSRDIRDGEEK